MRPDPIPYSSAGQFGFTNDLTVLQAVRQWCEAAVADGWVERDLDSWPAERRRSELKKDGFVAHCIMREKQSAKWACEAKIHLWGPDGPALKVPPLYDWEAIQRAVRRCEVCKADDVPTERVGFANRACASCAPGLRARIETPGWCN